ncbi:MAG: trypsin-like peptidase domain-containing protein [Clostridiales bacterium]|nr:trypsin-like peptidase domain-containing protein [Clostridiales bacterium]
MYEGQNSDIINNGTENDVNSISSTDDVSGTNTVDSANNVTGTDLRLTEGRFSSQTVNDNHYSNNQQNDYRYAQGTWQNPNYRPNAASNSTSYQYGSTRQSGNTYPTGNAYQSRDTYRSGNTYQNGNAYQTESAYQSGNAYQSINANQSSSSTVKKEKIKKEKKGNGYFKKALVCVSLGLIFGICAGLGFYVVDSFNGRNGIVEEQTENTAVHIPEEEVTNALLDEADEVMGAAEEVVSGSVKEAAIDVTATALDVSDMVASVMPAVVSINNTYTERISYFGQTYTSEAQASGSGIIVGENDIELLIATNYHVVNGADSLGVIFADGSEAEASLKGMDVDMDLAVIAVPLENIRTATLNQIAIAKLGDSDELKVGEPAIAIGNALGYGQSVTTGCISALDREMELEDGSTGTFIQTDAAINPGNSGGALLNINGEVIGINSNKIGGEVIEGMGYAIPISAASPIIADLMLKETKNKVAKDERGFLGISGVSVTQEIADDYGMPRGLYITKVYEDTPAEEIGLKKGDIITSFDGEEITSMDDLYLLLEYYAKGDTVELVVMKVGNNGYRSTKISVTLGEKTEQ